MSSLGVHAFFHTQTSTLTYVVWHPACLSAVVIDPVLDFDPATRIVGESSLSQVVRFLRSKNLNLEWILETHAHADHLSGARELRARFPGSRWAMGARLSEVFEAFERLKMWDSSKHRLSDLGVDRWLSDGEEMSLDGFKIQVIATPGHTPACLTYRMGEWLFTGDALIMPDAGVGRCDFPGGSAVTLYDSIWHRLYALDDSFEVFVGHDYQPGGRPLRFRCRLGEEKASNLHLRLTTSREDFVRFRTARDRTLSAPRLLQASLDWNLGIHQVVPRVTLP